jgi:mannonate dehydratase
MTRPKIALVVPALNERYLRLAAQMGVDEIVAGGPAVPGQAVIDYEQWILQKKRIEDAGLAWTTCEGIHIPDRVKLGQAGRDQDIEDFCHSLRNMGMAGVSTLCYNWMALFGWLRTSYTTRVRGQALACSYEHTLMQKAPLADGAPVTPELLWQTLEYFLKAVLPVAEEVGVRLAMHPDDPPLSPIRGVARIMSSMEGFERLLALVPSPANGITFCQGCFSELGVDLPEAIHTFGDQGKLFFAHFRDVKGTVTNFVETFHDEGKSDMFAAMRAYYEIGFAGPMRPDHVPMMEGDEGQTAGYTLLGRLFAVGYMKGLMESIEKTLCS